LARSRRNKKVADEKLNKVVLDSSVVIKWFSNEEGTDKALVIREKYINGDIEIAIPDLVLYEVANALRYNTSINENDIKEAVDSLNKLEIDIIVPTKEITNLAISYALKFGLTVYDAFFLSLADVLRFTCITADEKLYNKVKELGFVVLLNEINL